MYQNHQQHRQEADTSHWHYRSLLYTRRVYERLTQQIATRRVYERLTEQIDNCCRNIITGLFTAIGFSQEFSFKYKPFGQQAANS
jgi:hypothetical protein